ncbi:MAG: hypothetical protein EXR27_07265 [Betaproteobacteria bacterium]|nr:hypothetical protein [Betaproteobacteria bacterium]
MKLAAALLALSVSACVSGPTFDVSTKNSLFIATNYNAADQLAKNLRANNHTGPIIVATFSNIDNLVESSRFGRTLSEQIGSRLVQAGFQVIEVKLRDTVYVSAATQGEFLLSREMRDISATHKVNTVVVGTYADASNYAYVTVKAIALESGAVIASYDYSLPMIDMVRAMLPLGKK